MGNATKKEAASRKPAGGKPKKAAKLTPMMERYLEVKGQNPGSLLLFRMGDFYELFYEDAQLAAKILGITLTSRDKNSDNPIPMAGFPFRALDGYLQKIIRAAAYCEDGRLEVAVARDHHHRQLWPRGLELLQDL